MCFNTFRVMLHISTKTIFYKEYLPFYLLDEIFYS